ncbi:condensation domain-containing protein, partial [Chryseobacterium sp. JV558]
MWILSQFEAGNVAYSIPSSHHIQGSLDLVSLEESFRRIVSRHEILRT